MMMCEMRELVVMNAKDRHCKQTKNMVKSNEKKKSDSE